MLTGKKFGIHGAYQPFVAMTTENPYQQV